MGSATNTTFTTLMRESSAGKPFKKYKNLFKAEHPLRKRNPTCLSTASNVPSAAATTDISVVRVNLTGGTPAKVTSNPHVKIFGFRRKVSKQRFHTYGVSLLSPTLSLLEEIAARQEQGNAKLYELNTALADLNEKAHTLQRLHNKGFIEDADFREQSDTLASQRKKLSDQRTQAIHGNKALETLDKLRDLQRQLESLPEILWEFEIGLFDQLVEKIVPVSNTELLFKLKCGLELKEVIPQ